MYFDELPLDDRILDALYEMRYDTCTPIQEKTIPVLLEGKDIIGIAQTGTGKTAAYLLPVLNKLCTQSQEEGVTKCLIMVPTRELAIQIDNAIEAFSYYLPISSIAVYGGNDAIRYSQELKSLKMGADIIIATPGRLLSHLQLDNTDFSKISYFILDEADRMLDMGFSDDIINIASHLPKERQTMLFSATMPENIRKFAKSLLQDPVEVRIAVSKPASGINQQAYLCEEQHKIELVQHLFEERPPQRAIIFASSKLKVKKLAERLKKGVVKVSDMHSDLTQEERNRVMQDFKNGHLNVLVATDIIARGIDITDIQTVINYDVPHDAEDYIHRIGRTARAGKQGQAITFVCQADNVYFKRIEKIIGKPIAKTRFPEKDNGKPSKAESRGKSEQRSKSKQRNKTEQHAKSEQRGNDNKQDAKRRRHSHNRHRRSEKKSGAATANNQAPNKDAN
jgi:ATP-dependent RNA helicase RhlE